MFSGHFDRRIDRNPLQSMSRYQDQLSADNCRSHTERQLQKQTNHDEFNESVNAVSSQCEMTATPCREFPF